VSIHLIFYIYIYVYIILPYILIYIYIFVYYIYMDYILANYLYNIYIAASQANLFAFARTTSCSSAVWSDSKTLRYRFRWVVQVKPPFLAMFPSYKHLVRCSINASMLGDFSPTRGWFCPSWEEKFPNANDPQWVTRMGDS
jgi:hypothetical protein